MVVLVTLLDDLAGYRCFLGLVLVSRLAGGKLGSEQPRQREIPPSIGRRNHRKRDAFHNTSGDLELKVTTVDYDHLGVVWAQPC